MAYAPGMGALAVLAAAGLVGAAPAIYTFAAAPDRFIFGNLTYARLNTAYYQQHSAGQPGMTLLQKLTFTFELVFLQPGNLLILLLAVLELWRVRKSLRLHVAPEIFFGLLLLLSFWVGAYAPTPMQQQYIYPMIPLLLLLFIGALAYDHRPRIPVGVLGVSALLAMVFAAPRYVEGAEIVFDPAEWFPLKVHARGEGLAELVDGKRVLTLAPIYPLEGGAAIYPELVTGPLGWRVAPLLSAEERSQVGLVGLDELAADLASRTPRGVFIGVHDDDATAEEPLLAYATQGRYVPVALPEEGVLWTAPIARWDEQIQLGAVDLPSHPLAPGQSFVATLQLQALTPLVTNFNVLVRIVGSDGAEVLRQEGWPWGRPTTSWEVGEVWPDGHEFTLPAEIAPGPYKIEVTFYDPATLALVGEPATAGYIVVDGKGSTGQKPLAKFADGITLQSATAPANGWKPGATQEVRLTWVGVQPERGNYTAFLHLAGPNGLVAQRDQAPLGGFYPTDVWLPGLPVEDRYPLELPNDLAPGTYTLLAGLYDPVTGQRLALLDGAQPSGDAYVVATVQVE
ncbi:MAG: hypothetical protein IPK16_23215 [Anaerolineales bacterium]|nr:hypothetical protein [Anaerolineales bacterium]